MSELFGVSGSGAGGVRPEVTVFWQPGCTSCVKAKEFIVEHGFEFESINVLEHAEAMREVSAAGLRSIPAVRRGDKYIYAQSLDDIAELLGVSRGGASMSRGQLIRRWDEVMEVSKGILLSFDEAVLQRPVIHKRERTIAELGAHIFQIAESFMRQVEDDSIDARAIYIIAREDIKTRGDLLDYVNATHKEYRDLWVDKPNEVVSETLKTHYGLQPFALVLERGVWHSAQHARQLDFVAAGMGAELQIRQELYAGLPLPQRLWS